MVIFAIGGVVLGSVIGAVSYDDYACHSDYSDIAEREQAENELRLSELNNQKEQLKEQLLVYKKSEMDKYLGKSKYASMDGNNIDSGTASMMNKYVKGNIVRQEKSELEKCTESIKKEIEEIDGAIKNLENIRENISK